ncbi:hypothetical protein MY11210_007157 [Beauveria gryllotalpidicola]
MESTRHHNIIPADFRLWFCISIQNHPPNIDESSARKVRFSTGIERFQIPIHAWPRIPTPNNATSTTDDLNELIDALVSGKGSVSIAALVGEADARRLGNVVTNISRLYGAGGLSQHALHHVVLGVMAMCLVAARPPMRVRRELPHNPCIIAGMAVLLADSNMAADKVIPAGSEWLGVEDLQSVRPIAA